MIHEPEFHKTPSKAEAQAKARELAACYARLFLGSDDGKRVLADLRAKFGLHRLVFVKGENGRYDTLAAAVIDGQRQVLSEIEDAIRAGAPGQALSNNQTA